MIGLVDADILLYRAGFAAEKKNKETGEKQIEPASHAIQCLNTIIDYLPFEKKEFYLSGKNNFRYAVATIKPYKGNRKPEDKPVHYNALRNYVLDKYKAIVAEGEADDLLGIEQTSREGTCIVTIDKDLNQIPGAHYNFVKQQHYNVSERDGHRSFYRQLLTGDRSDNIPGIDGIGDKRASAIIDQYGTEHAMWAAAKYCWHQNCPDGLSGLSVGEAITEVATLLWISRKGRERWREPTRTTDTGSDQ